jgi:hypothetical protein
MNIAEIIPQDNHVLYVKSEEGEVGLFDITPFLESEAFVPLKNIAEFEKIHNGRYFIEWECGADLSADTIQARWQPLGDPSAQQGVPGDSPQQASLASGRP